MGRLDIEKMESERDVEALIKALDNEDFKARIAAVDALVRIGLGAIEPLIRTLRNKELPLETRKSGAYALGKIGDRRAIPPLMEVYNDKSVHFGLWREVKQALQTLGVRSVDRGTYLGRIDIDGMERDNDVEGLIGVLALEDLDVRFRTVDALVRIGESAVEPLIRALKDEHWLVRGGATGALSRIGDIGVVEPLIQLLKDGDWTDRQGAASALGKIGDARAVEPLTQALKDENASVREAAKEALQKIKTKKSKKIVEKL